MSLRGIAVDLKKLGHVIRAGKQFSAQQVKDLLADKLLGEGAGQ